jgi:micrococcal nuclease
MESLYFYKAKVISVYDGDTIKVEIDLGFGIKKTGASVRLFGLNAPEVKGDDRNHGLISRDWLRNKIEGKDVILKTIKDSTEKYGRYLGIIFTIEGENVNESLISEGLAIKKKY